MPDDFPSITEFPGRQIGRYQLEVISLRYAFASKYLSGKRVLEVGCGPGLGLGLLAGRAKLLVAGEISTESLKMARTTYHDRADIRLVQFDAHWLPFAGKSFDIVLALAVVYYLDIRVFLQECRRILRSDGTLIFCTPNRSAPGFQPSRFSTAYYSVQELAELLSQHGFRLDAFGAFRIPPKAEQIGHRVIAIGGTVLSSFPLAIGAGIRRIISPMIGYKRDLLKPQLDEEEMQLARGIEVSPVSVHCPNPEYRVLYGVAQRAGR